MANITVDAKMLCKAFLAGAQRIEAKKEYINELNVFPVPDGDTGTNMTMTIMSAAREVSGLGENPEMKTLAYFRACCKHATGPICYEINPFPEPVFWWSGRRPRQVQSTG